MSSTTPATHGKFVVSPVELDDGIRVYNVVFQAHSGQSCLIHNCLSYEQCKALAASLNEAVQYSGWID